MRAPSATRLPRSVPVGQARRTMEAVRIIRANFVFGVLLVLLALLLGRFATLQLVHGDEYRAQADSRHGARLTLVGVRGRILDVKGRLLATSSFGREVAVDTDPRSLPEARLEAFCERLATILDGETTPGELLARIREARARRTPLRGPLGLRWMCTGVRHLVLRAHVEEPRVVAALDEASVGRERLPGLKISTTERRSCPNGDYAAHVIGLPPGSGEGEGIEGLLDERLDGGQVSARMSRDGKARWHHQGESIDRSLLAGGEVRLTLDIVVQHHVERALDRLLAEWAPQQAVAIVLDPRTGAVLALANRPTFDPNPRGRRAPVSANLAVYGCYEPGSSFKPFTVAWALARGLPADTIVPMPIRTLFAGDRQPINDTHYIGDGDVVKLLAQSSNTGAAWLSDWMEPRGMPELIAWLDLGHPTGVELPHERAWSAAGGRLSRADQLRTAFGHALTVTPIRLAAAFTAFARDDARPVRPTLVPGTQAPRLLAVPLCSAEALAVVRRGLEGCVDEGTARVAFEGSAYAVAGKTGTALVARDTQHVCTFVGYAPRAAPRLVVLVLAVTKRSQDGSGGKVSAPAVRCIIDEVLPYLGVAPDLGVVEPVALAGGGP